MDVKGFFGAIALLFGSLITTIPQSAYAQQFVAETAHFRVFTNDPALAREVGEMAEAYRTHLATHWLGHSLPEWFEKVPVVVHCHPRLLASGETKYVLAGGQVRQIQMVLSGTRERILDSVLPHEMTHCVLATHFAVLGKPLPRWADEGACTTVEHNSERTKHDKALIQFMVEGRCFPFNALFAMREYPKDMMPLYAQGYSLCAFLIAQGGPKQFVQFLQRGMQDEDWAAAVAEYYGYPKLGKLQSAWQSWVQDGGGKVQQHTAVALGYIPAGGPVDRGLNAATPGNTRLASAQIASSGIAPSGTIAELPAPVARPSNTPTSNTFAALVGGPSDPFLNTQVRPSGSPISNGNAVSITRTSGYYQQQFELHQQQQNSSTVEAIPTPVRQGPSAASSQGLPTVSVQAAQPAPFQTIGGTIYR
ncbi:MAG: hypothetical protein ACK5OB_10610 [Pirellula sp.]|jgi:hypothetical protein